MKKNKELFLSGRILLQSPEVVQEMHLKTLQSLLLLPRLCSFTHTHISDTSAE